MCIYTLHVMLHAYMCGRVCICAYVRSSLLDPCSPLLCCGSLLPDHERNVFVPRMWWRIKYGFLLAWIIKKEGRLSGAELMNNGFWLHSALSSVLQPSSIWLWFRTGFQSVYLSTVQTPLCSQPEASRAALSTAVSRSFLEGAS